MNWSPSSSPATIDAAPPRQFGRDDIERKRARKRFRYHDPEDHGGFGLRTNHWIRQLSICVLFAAGAVQAAAAQAQNNPVPAMQGAPQPDRPPPLADPQVAQARAVNDLIGRGNSAMNNNDLNAAIALFDRALQMAPHNEWALADRGLAYVWKDDATRALQDLDAAAQIDPRNYVVAHARGVLALRAGNYPEAEAQFTAALELHSNDEFALRQRSQVYELAGDLDHALADSAALIRLNPAKAYPYELHADALRRSGHGQDALQEADVLLTANPQNAEAYASAAQIYLAGGKSDFATLAMERSLALAPKASAYLARAESRTSDDRDGRRADIEAALRLEPDNNRGLADLADLQADNGQYAGALDSLAKDVSVHGETVGLLARRAAVHARNNQVKLADQDAAAARAKASTAGQLNDMCWTLATHGVELERALSACDAALTQAPAASTILDSRGFTLLRMGRYADSIAAYDAALKAPSPQAMSLYGRGVAKHRNGDLKGGDADLQAALRVDARAAIRFADFGVSP
jgi:tetratricopeptide (TPR) repeat protein